MQRDIVPLMNLCIFLIYTVQCTLYCIHIISRTSLILLQWIRSPVQYFIDYRSSSINTFLQHTVFCSSYFHFSHSISFSPTSTYCIPSHQLVLDVYILRTVLIFYYIRKYCTITNVSSFLVFMYRAQALILICFGYRLTSTACIIHWRSVVWTTGSRSPL